MISSIAIIYFREFLEIALLLGVILAVTKPIKNSRYFVLLGFMLGVTLAFSFAIAASAITEMYDGLGDELFNSAIILLTAAIISWTVIWMQGYTKKIRHGFQVLSDKIATGSSSKFLLVLLVASTILREGAEIMLFTYSFAQTSMVPVEVYIFDIALGTFMGVMVGYLIYIGLLKFASKYVFKISTILLILIAAGLAAEAAGILTSAGIIDVLDQQLWDSSAFISNHSTVGKLLKIIIGYDAKPNALQVLFYLGTIGLNIFMIMYKNNLSKNAKNNN